MNFSKLKNQDWIITAITFLLLLIGTVVIYSTTFQAETVSQGAGSLTKQLIFILIGLGAYFFLTIIDYSWFKIGKIQILIYIFIILLLIVVLFTDPINNARRWINIGFINIQPSEFAKIVVILFSANIFSSSNEFKKVELPWKTNKRSAVIENNQRKLDFTNLMNFFDKESLGYKIILSIATTLPIVLLVFIQPAFGSSVIIFSIWVLILYLILPYQLGIGLIGMVVLSLTLISSGAINLNGLYSNIGISPIFHNVDLLLSSIVILLGALIFYLNKVKLYFIPICVLIGFSVFPFYKYFTQNILSDYQQKRIEAFLNPEKDLEGSRWQVEQSKIAIGSGRLWGRGFLQGTQSKLRFLPFAHTDFIFAAMAEQFGLVRSTFVLGLFAALIGRILYVANKTSDQYGTIVCVGIASMLLLHVFINVGMNLGELPVTGIPLPLVSYGGSSVLVNLIGLGIVQSIATNGKVVDSGEQLMILSK